MPLCPASLLRFRDRGSGRQTAESRSGAPSPGPESILETPYLADPAAGPERRSVPRRLRARGAAAQGGRTGTPLPARKLRAAQKTIEIRYSWAAMPSRVYEIDILECPKCCGRRMIIGSIQAPSVVDQILRHLGYDDGTTEFPSQPVVVDDAGAV